MCSYRKRREADAMYPDVLGGQLRIGFEMGTHSHTSVGTQARLVCGLGLGALQSFTVSEWKEISPADQLNLSSRSNS